MHFLLPPAIPVVDVIERISEKVAGCEGSASSSANIF